MQSLKYNCLLVISGLFLAGGCTKTEDLPPLSQSRILSFKVPTADGDIIGAIDESDQTITVYVPFYHQFAVIDPEIILSDGAKLEAESLPVHVLDEGVRYTVIGNDGSKSVYSLTIHLQQITPFTLLEPSTEALTAKWEIGYGMVSIQANFNTSDPSNISVYLVDEAGAEHPLRPNTALGNVGVAPAIIGDGQKTYSFGSLRIPQELNPGLYHLKVDMLNLSTTSTYPVELVWGKPSGFIYNPVSIKAGETFTLETGSISLHDVREVSFLVNSEKLPLEIVEWDHLKVTARVPADLAPGTYTPALVCGDFGPVSPFWGITIVK